METRTRGKGTIDRGLRGSVGTLDDVNPTRLSKRSQAVPLQVGYIVRNIHQLNLLPKPPFTHSRESHLQPQELLR